MQLVLLPGMDGTGTLFSAFEAALDPAIAACRIAYPNDRPHRYDELEPWVAARLPAGQPYVLLGESFSGPLAIRLAAQRPPGLAGVILCCSFAQSPSRVARPMSTLLKLLPAHHLPAELPLFNGFANAHWRMALRSALSTCRAGVLAMRLAEVLRVDVRAKLRQIDVPMLYLRANRDRLVSHREADRIAARHGRTAIVDIDAPHMLLQMAPIEAAQAVAAFVATLPPPPTAPGF